MCRSALPLVHVQSLNLPGSPRRPSPRTEGVDKQSSHAPEEWEQAWHAQVKRVRPASVWGTTSSGATGHRALPLRPDPCPHEVLTYRDWAGAQTNNVILALMNALWVSHVCNRTLLLSVAASDMMQTLFDSDGSAFVLVHGILSSHAML